MEDLNLALSLRWSGDFAVLYHAWWVPRPVGSDLRYIYPAPVTKISSTHCRTDAGWPSLLTDRIAGIQPIVSDYCYAASGQTNMAYANAGHSMGTNNLRSVNLAFTDGHVETHVRSVIQWQFYGANGTAFY
jgi:prepilin-type processing-associated H-X9-DG protein